MKWTGASGLDFKKELAVQRTLNPEIRLFVDTTHGVFTHRWTMSWWGDAQLLDNIHASCELKLMERTRSRSFHSDSRWQFLFLSFFPSFYTWSDVTAGDKAVMSLPVSRCGQGGLTGIVWENRITGKERGRELKSRVQYIRHVFHACATWVINDDVENVWRLNLSTAELKWTHGKNQTDLHEKNPVTGKNINMRTKI